MSLVTLRKLLIAHCAICLFIVLALLFGGTILAFFSRLPPFL